MANCPRCGNVKDTSSTKCSRCGFDFAASSVTTFTTPEQSEGYANPATFYRSYSIIKRLPINYGIGETYLVGKGGEEYILKQQDFISTDDFYKKQIIRTFNTEVEIFGNLHIPGTPRLVEYNVDDNGLSIIFSYAHAESLLNKLFPEAIDLNYQSKKSPLIPDLSVALTWAKQLAHILQSLHQQKPYPLLHSNLSPDTIIVTPENQLMLLDLGHLRSFILIHLYNSKVNSKRNNPFYNIPQNFQRDDIHGDIYAYGRILDFIFTGTFPTNSETLPNLALLKEKYTKSDPRFLLAYISEKCCTSNDKNGFHNTNELVALLTDGFLPEASITTERIVCSTCGVSNRISARFCIHCGTLLHTSAPQLDPKSSEYASYVFDKSNQDHISKSLKEGRISGLTKFFLWESLNRVQTDPGLDALICLDSLSKIDKMPYQHEAALKVLHQMRGQALLADEVGLGKSIEAGIILKELIVRGLAEKILIICPPQLLAQWQMELFDKFDELFLVMGINIDTSLAWNCNRLIAPYNIIEQRFQAEEMLQQSYDLVILDEAHYLNEENNWKILQSIQNLRKKYFLLLSATPMHNDIKELYNIITLLRPGHFEDWKSFHDRYVIEKRIFTPEENDSPELIDKILAAKVARRSKNSIIEFDEQFFNAEKLQIALDKAGFGEDSANVIKLWEKADLVQVGIKNPVELRETMMQVMIRNIRSEVTKVHHFPIRKAIRFELDLLPDANDFYKRFRDFYQKGLRKINNRYFRYQMGEIVERLSSSPAAFSAGIRNRLTVKVQRQLGDKFINELKRFEVDCPINLIIPKLQLAFEKALEYVRHGDKVLIFSQFNETIKYAFEEANRIPDLDEICFKYDEFDSSVEKFQTLRNFQKYPSGAILFCPSEISEGVNLQYARVMINLDLPWDPMKIEQRIGRIQRLGGHPTVNILNIVFKDTIEEEIISILEQKILMFEAVVGKVEEIIGNLSQADDFRSMICDLYMNAKIENEEGRIISAQERINGALDSAIRNSSDQQSDNLINQVLNQETKQSIFFQTPNNDMDW